MIHSHHSNQTEQGGTGQPTTEEHDERYQDGVRLPMSRRRLLQATAGTAALALGGSLPAAAQAEQACELWDQIVVGDGDFILFNNKWGMQDASQCIWRNDDGSYGYDFTATSGGINYPQVFVGIRPWGEDTGVPDFPIRRGDVDEFVLEVDVDVNITGPEWNLAAEWWLMNGPPAPENPPHTHEIMVVLDHNQGHDHGGMNEASAWTDQFGNTIDYWVRYDAGGTSADFHIFRVSGGMQSGRVDLKPVIDFMSDRYGVSQDLTLTGLELGTEYWGGTQGDVTYNQVDVTINGTTYTSGNGSNNNNNNDEEPGDCIEIANGQYCADGPDVNGNGGNDFDDVVTFFENMDDPGIQNNVDQFDFNGNGGIDFDDVVALFEQI